MFRISGIFGKDGAPGIFLESAKAVSKMFEGRVLTGHVKPGIL